MELTMTRNDRITRIRINNGKVTKSAPKLWLQHAGAFTACLSAFAVGNALGWSSPAGPLLLKGEAGFQINKEEISLIGSLVTIGAAVSCLPAGYITDRIGRKNTLLCMIPIFTIGWALIIWATCVRMIYAGRFLLGICTGAVCVTAPVYSAEISQKEIRGRTGSYFQLLLASGILFVYVVGSQLEVAWFSFACGLVPIIFGSVFIFFPETPVYYLTKGKLKKARKSLKFYRGSDYNLELELQELSECTAPVKNDQEESSWDVFTSKEGFKSLMMSIGMMIFQQLSGINAFVFNSTDIFEQAGSFLESKHETIIIGVMQVFGALFSTFLVDYLGRILLLGLSACFMSICTFILGIYFFFIDVDIEVKDFFWLPLFSLCVFIIMFSVGYGSVPWMMMPEIIPSKIKGSASSIACATNWLSAFLVTEFFLDLTKTCGRGGTFWIFSGISALAAVFSFKILPETKGKSFDEIQKQLSGIS